MADLQEAQFTFQMRMQPARPGQTLTAGDRPSPCGWQAAGILLAAGLFAGIASMIRNFLPRD
jgi:hypothetical protein